MNWKVGTPSEDFVSFAIRYPETRRQSFLSNNRIAFPDLGSGGVNPEAAQAGFPHPEVSLGPSRFADTARGLRPIASPRVFAEPASTNSSYGEFREATIDSIAKPIPDGSMSPHSRFYSSPRPSSDSCRGRGVRSRGLATLLH